MDDQILTISVFKQLLEQKLEEKFNEKLALAWSRFDQKFVETKSQISDTQNQINALEVTLLEKLKIIELATNYRTKGIEREIGFESRDLVKQFDQNLDKQKANFTTITDNHETRITRLETYIQ